MPSLQDELAAVSELIRRVKPAEAEEKVRRLFKKLGGEELRGAADALRAVIGEFLPARRKALTAALEERLRETAPRPAVSPARPPTPPSVAPYVPPPRNGPPSGDWLADLRARMKDLSERYIFQWSTWYRDLVSDVFDRAIPRLQSVPDDDTLTTRLEDAFSHHAMEIFAKGYEYKTARGTPPEDAVVISLHGLQRFLDLPLTFYVAKTTASTDMAAVRAARKVCAALLSGIVQGYGHAKFGTKQGWHLLPQHPGVWAHCLAFLSPSHVNQVARQVEAGDFQSGLEHVVQPVVEAVDAVMRQAPVNLGLLPRIGQYSHDARRLEIALELPHPAEGRRYLDIHCYLFGREVGRETLLEESANRSAALIALAVQPDLQEWIEHNDWLRKVVIDANDEPKKVSGRALDLLNHTVSRLAGAQAWQAPLTCNFARYFPLTKPHLQKYFRVHRTSVRDLLRSFEHGTGIRLWCSVRRSGKTTAGFDLSSSSGAAVVVTQTCEPTGQQPGEDYFIESVKAALDSGARLPRHFVRDTIGRCADARGDSGKKVIFVLDEYETLFNEMRLALRKDYEQAREYVVKPLLNQLVEFSRDNLVLLIGMQPNAHNILMDQNQLSPSVQQDEFPLFEHRPGAEGSEFVALLTRVLGHVAADPSFTDALHAETGGHPFLTVNLLVDLFEWLIRCRRPAAGLTLTADDFRAYAALHLTPEAIRQCTEYDFFRDFTAGALDPRYRDRHPWLFAVCNAVVRLARQDPVMLACPRERFGRLVDGIRLPEGFNHPDHLLRTAQQANFLAVQGDVVRPRIPIMARIASATHPLSRA